MTRPTVAHTLMLALLTTGASLAEVQFVENGVDRGIGPYVMAAGMGGGVAAADFDNDGDIDLFVPNETGVADQLYRNRGDGSFDEIAAAAGVASTTRGRVGLWLDYDGDHRLDLLVAGDCFEQSVPACAAGAVVRLYRQTGDATFADVTAAAGLAGRVATAASTHLGGVAAGDLDNDGFLDVVLGNWGGRAYVFVNNGDGSFSDVSSSTAIGATVEGHWQPVMYDFDADGWLDIYWAIDYTDNHLWLNQGDLTFVDGAVALGINNAWNDMGIALGDYDNGGTPDIYVTNIGTNVLYRNDSAGALMRFYEEAGTAGVGSAGWAWGTTFFDADRDGLLDLAVTNGFMESAWPADASRFYRNQGGSPVTFADESTATGFDDTYWGSALAALDHDRDGDLDLVQSTQTTGSTASALRLLESELTGTAQSNGYLVVRPRMTGANQRAIGAVVRATAGTTEMMRPITAGISFQAQEPAEAFFGLGTATQADRVVIDWPGGGQTQLLDVPANQVLTVTVETDTDGDGLADVDDTDDDDDGVPDVADCFPTNARVWAVPGEVTDLVLSHTGTVTTLTWTAPAAPGGVAPRYDALMASDPSFGPAVTCPEPGSDTEASDGPDPAVGVVHYFAIRARNRCGVGPVGTDSLGSPRAAAGCPAP